MNLFKIIIVVQIISIFLIAETKTLYVSTKGQDGNSGSFKVPLQTIVKALDIVEKGSNNDVYNIVLRGGEYFLSEPMKIDFDKKLTIIAYENEKVVCSGGIELQLKWRKYKDGIYKAKIKNDVEDIEQLFVNGEKQILARYPNFVKNKYPYNGTSEDAISTERVKTWSNPIGGYIHALHRAEWGGYHYKIKGVKKNGELDLIGGFQNNRQMGMHKEHRFVENIFEELESPGEFFYNKEERILYFYPPENLKLKKAEFIVPQIENIITIENSENVEISNIEFKHTKRTFMKTKEPLLRSDWAIYRNGTIFIKNSENINIQNCTFDAVGGNAIFVSDYAKNIIIEACHIKNAGASGICFVGSIDAVRSPSFEYYEFVDYAEMDLIPGPKTTQYPRECYVRDNLIERIGRVEKQVAGVQIQIAENIYVGHNSIYHIPRSGINIGDGSWGGHVLEYNDVFETVLETGDHGAFNSWGRDRFWHPNRNTLNQLMKDHRELIYLDPRKTTIIRNNRFKCEHGWDIDLDDGSSNYHIYNNLCLSGGLKLREGFNRTVENNMMINNTFHPHVWFENCDDVFRQNVVFMRFADIALQSWGKEIDWNLHLSEESLEYSKSKGLGKNSIASNVAFLNPLIGDFRIKNDEVIEKIGFHNFPMDQFGVKSERLRKIAKQPEFPAIFTNNSNIDQVVQWLGAKIKNLTTLGEQSATGMADKVGILILDVESESIISKSKLQKNDVILQLDGKDVNNLNQLMKQYKSCRWKGSVPGKIFRNQKEVDIHIFMK